MLDNTKTLTTCLWFNYNGREAAEYYVSLFPNSRIKDNWVTETDTPGNEAHTEVVVNFELFGQPFIALNGGPQFPHSEAVSFQIPCETQEEVDFYWDRLIADGGQESNCGWLKDKFGVSWQVCPAEMNKYLDGPDPEGCKRATEAMLKMTKINLEEMRKAYEG